MKLSEAEQHLDNLLAVIFRDGGHRAASYSTLQEAVDAAHEEWARLVQAAEGREVERAAELAAKDRVIERLRAMIHELRHENGGAMLNWSYWKDHNPQGETETREVWLNRWRADEDAHIDAFDVETNTMIESAIQQAKEQPASRLQCLRRFQNRSSSGWLVAKIDAALSTSTKGGE